MGKIDTSTHRMAYANAVSNIEFADENGNKEYVVNRAPNPKKPGEKNAKTITMTESFIRTRNRLQSTLTTYSFGILDNQPSSSPAGANNGLYSLEQRLALQDVFFVYALGFYVYMVATPGGNGSFEFEPMTFPNPNFYGAFGLNLDAMVQLWTGAKMNVTVNGDVLTPAYSLQRHLFIPETEINAINWPGGDNPENYFNQIDAESDGMKSIEPNWILNGGNKNNFVINYPQTLNNIGLTTSENLHLELFMVGFLAQNASSIMNNQSKS